MEEKKTVINSSEAPSGAAEMSSVDIKIVGESGELLKSFAGKVNVLLQQNLVGQSCAVSFRDAAGKEVHTVTVKEARHIYQSGSSCVFLRVSQGSTVVQFSSRTDTEQFVEYLYSILSPSIKSLKGKESVFSLRTDNASASQYFMFYSYLSQQQNMLQDSVRTSTYQSAMLQNIADFKDKVVLDVGAGSGILSFFAVQAGARKVYAVEASTMAIHCMDLVTSNRLSDKVTVLPGKIEEIDVPEKVDVIVSEPMGYMLYNERMLETYLHAKKWLKTDGLMYPTKGMLYCAPFSDELLFIEQYNKANFWTQPHFYGINLASLNKKAVEEYFRQPIVDTFDVRILMAKPVGHTTDFRTASETDLHHIKIPVNFQAWSSGTIHGLAFWFDVAFLGTQRSVWLSTAPFQPLTHWYQVRCLLQEPLFVHIGQEVSGYVDLKANERQSYDVEVYLVLGGSGKVSRAMCDLKNPYFRYTMVPPQPPPGTTNSNPTEQYWSQGSSTNQAPSSNPQQQQQHPALMLNTHNASYNLPQMIVNGTNLIPNPSPPHGAAATNQQHQAIPIQLHSSVPAAAQTAIHTSPVPNRTAVMTHGSGHHFFHPQPQVTYTTPIIY